MYQSTRHDIPDDLNFQKQCREIFSSRITQTVDEDMRYSDYSVRG